MCGAVNVRQSLCLACALVLLAFTPIAAGAVDKPNVLLIVIDTLRADHLGVYGYTRPTSPRLDALAASGVRFANARSTSGWTAPSVASILTGFYPINHGIELPGARLGPKTPTLALGLRTGGYQTAAYSANPAFVSQRQGFDRGFDEFEVLRAGIADSKEDADVVVGAPTSKNLKVANAGQVSDASLEWLSRVDTSKPFFLYLHYFDPHGGYYPPPEYAKRFGVSPDSPMLTVKQHEFWSKLPGPEDLQTLKALYDGEVAFTDHEIGRVLDALPADRPTLIVVSADHGEEFMDHGGMSHGRTLFEEELRVPLIFAGPSVKPGVVVQVPVIIADIWPTLAEMIGLPVPADIDGRSLASSVREGQEPPARTLFADLVKANKRQIMIHRHAVLRGSRKLLQNMTAGYDLYDLGTDPGEQHDLLPQEEERAAPLEMLLTVRESRKKNLTGWRSRPVPTVALSAQDKERMRALGYDPE